jgi:hypothetical protein
VDELEENIENDDDVDDGRERPKYEFLYRQAVGTEDAYLGSNDKDPSSTCCEGMILRVEMPGTPSMADIDLDVQVRASPVPSLPSLPGTRVCRRWST